MKCVPHTPKTLCQHSENLLRASVGTRRGHLCNTSPGTPETPCRDSLNTLWGTLKHVAEPSVPRCGHPPNTPRVPSKHAVGILESRRGYPPNTLRVPLEKLQGVPKATVVTKTKKNCKNSLVRQKTDLLHTH